MAGGRTFVFAYGSVDGVAHQPINQLETGRRELARLKNLGDLGGLGRFAVFPIGFQWPVVTGLVRQVLSRAFSISTVCAVQHRLDAGLLTYPFFVERSLTTTGQSQLWSLVFVMFALLSGWLSWRWLVMRGQTDDPGERPATEEPETERPTRGQRLRWLWLAAYGSAMLLATTNHVCQDVAVIPLLWVIPLSLYLLSFVICFDNPRWYCPLGYGRGLVVTSLLAAIVMRMGGKLPVMIEVATFLVLLLCACMVCHGELVRRRLDRRYLTMFYQYCAAGGAVGGLLVSVVCPRLFCTFMEMNVGVVVAYLLGLSVLATNPSAPWIGRRQKPQVAAMAIGYLGLLVIAWGQFGSGASQALAATRSFYGVLTVHDREVPMGDGSLEDVAPRALRELSHGRVQHGSQWLDDDLRRVPTTYYAEETAVGQLLRSYGDERPTRVGVIGLGAG